MKNGDNGHVLNWCHVL